MNGLENVRVCKLAECCGNALLQPALLLSAVEILSAVLSLTAQQSQTGEQRGTEPPLPHFRLDSMPFDTVLRTETHTHTHTCIHKHTEPIQISIGSFY